MRTIGPALLAAALLAAAPSSAQEVGDIAAGGAYFAETCAECHEDPEALAGAFAQSDPTAMRAELEAFLADHFAEEDEDRANVIAYLLAI